MSQQATHEPAGAAPVTPAPRVAVETNGINVIDESERKGTPRQLFWPWFGANVSVLGLAYGSFLFGFGISFWQAVAAGSSASWSRSCSAGSWRSRASAAPRRPWS
jgi:NCS1 family nucleobase:cation symporter-1